MIKVDKVSIQATQDDPQHPVEVRIPLIHLPKDSKMKSGDYRVTFESIGSGPEVSGMGKEPAEAAKK